MKHITPDELAHTLDRSIELHEAVLELTESFEPFPGLHFELAFQSALLSMEHAMASMLLLQSEMEAPGMALLRPQFESLVRAFWLMYSASEAQVEKLSMPLTIETARRGDDLPKLSDMLKRLAATPEAPAHIVAQLNGWEVNPNPMLTNTCYSMVDAKNCIHVASVHEYVAAEKTFKTVAGSGGVSSPPPSSGGKSSSSSKNMPWPFSRA